MLDLRLVLVQMWVFSGGNTYSSGVDGASRHKYASWRGPVGWDRAFLFDICYAFVCTFLLIYVNLLTRRLYTHTCSIMRAFAKKLFH